MGLFSPDMPEWRFVKLGREIDHYASREWIKFVELLVFTGLFNYLRILEPNYLTYTLFIASGLILDFFLLLKIYDLFSALLGSKVRWGLRYIFSLIASIAATHFIVNKMIALVTSLNGFAI